MALHYARFKIFLQLHWGFMIELMRRSRIFIALKKKIIVFLIFGTQEHLTISRTRNEFLKNHFGGQTPQITGC